MESLPDSIDFICRRNNYPCLLLVRLEIESFIILNRSVIFSHYYRSLNDYSNHPVAIKLSSFSSHNSWKEAANEINREFRHIDKFSTGTLFNRVYLTENWLIKVSLYTINVSNHDSMHLVLTDSTELDLSINNAPSTQFLNIVVKPIPGRKSFKEFKIRLNSLEYKDFCDKLQNPVQHACDVVIKQSLPEQFLDSFRRQLSLNNKYQMKRNVNRYRSLFK